MWWKFSRDVTAAAFEAQQVIALRMMKLAQGGPAAQQEVQKMVSEKIMASTEAVIALAKGSSPESVVRRYRTIMRANEKRLAGRKKHK
jgi:hypothetical protein